MQHHRKTKTKKKSNMPIFTCHERGLNYTPPYPGKTLTLQGWMDKKIIKKYS